MRTLLLATAAVALLASQARAAGPDLSPDTKRMLAYGTLAVMTGACKTTLTPAQSAQLNTGLQKASAAQKDMNEAQFTEVMKTVGAQLGENKEQICAALTPDYIDASLQEAATGE